MLRVAERYKVSSSYLARVCKTLNVPKPPVGYWAQVQAGRKLKQPPLLAVRSGDPTEWTPGTAVFPSTPIVGREASDSTAKRQPPKGLHPILRGVREILVGSKESDGYLKPTKRFMIDVLTSKTTVNRTLNAADKLFAALENAGQRVTFSSGQRHFTRVDFDERKQSKEGFRYPTPWRPDRPTLVYIDSVAIGLTLGEISEEIDAVYVNGNYVPAANLSDRVTRNRGWTNKHAFPSGRLRLQAYSPHAGTKWQHRWDETLAGDFDQQIPEIIRALERAAPTIRGLVDDSEKAAERQRLEAEERRRQYLADEERREHQAKIENADGELFEMILSWHEQQLLDAFCEAMVRRSESLPPEERQAFIEKISDIKDRMSLVDPFVTLQSWTHPEPGGKVVRKKAGKSAASSSLINPSERKSSWPHDFYSNYPFGRFR